MTNKSSRAMYETINPILGFVDENHPQNRVNGVSSLGNQSNSPVSVQFIGDSTDSDHVSNTPHELSINSKDQMNSQIHSELLR